MCIIYVYFSVNTRGDDSRNKYIELFKWLDSLRSGKNHHLDHTSISYIFTSAQSDNFRAGYLQFATWKPCHCHWNGSCYVGDHTVPLSARSYSSMCLCCDAVITGRAHTFVNNEGDLVGRVTCPYTSPLRSGVSTTLPLSALRLFLFMLLQRGYYSLRFPVSSRLCFLHHHFVPRVPVSVLRSPPFSLPREGYKARLSS